MGHLGPSVGSEKVSCGWKDGKMDGGWRQAADGICEENCKNFGENPLALSSWYIYMQIYIYIYFYTT